MSRALGLHQRGDDLAYALVEQLPERPPAVLAAGSVSATSLVATFRTLSAGRPVRWGLAWEVGGHRPPRLPAGWPLRHPPTQALVHPAFAAALWEWQLGRIDEADLFLWLREDRLCWSRGEPGTGMCGSLPRASSLRETLAAVLQRFPAGTPLPVAVARARQAPGFELLMESLAAAGHRLRELRPDAAEGGTDLAAAGAALAALEPDRAGVHPPLPAPRGLAAFLAGCAATVLVLGGSWLLGATQREELATVAAEAHEVQLATARRPAALAAPPAEIVRLLDRLESVRHGLEGVLSAAPAGSVLQFEAVTARGSPAAQLRVELDESQPGFDPASLPPGLTLRPGEARAGRLLYLGTSGPEASR